MSEETKKRARFWITLHTALLFWGVCWGVFCLFHSNRYALLFVPGIVLNSICVVLWTRTVVRDARRGRQ